ncbi:MAG: DUF2252 family protein [Alphaproteobacteria bacterium]|nr:DUF2252 family protein [Alphaproteobacteria bacterium]
MASSISGSPAHKHRPVILAERRNAKMARSAHAYMRGNTVKFYEWLETAAGKSLPDGPPVWICGDCHVGNLGPVASLSGRVNIQIRDLDQTVIGNPAHDLIRLGLSLATAARSSDLPGVTTARMIEEMMIGYTAALSDGHRKRRPEKEAKPVQRVMEQALKRRWCNLAEERIADVRPAIPRGDKFWQVSPGEDRQLKELFASDEVRKLVTGMRSRADDARIKVLDAAYWVKGCSSLGRLRYAVLLGIAKKRPSRGEICLVDIKEATTAAAPRSPDAQMPRDNAERVVTGARALAPNLGERMLAARLNDKPVVIRELLPQDLKLEIEQLTHSEAVNAARFLATVVGEAHARQMDRATRLSWRKAMLQKHTKTLDAPSWFWSSIVELVASHEAAYLEHCRRYQPAA